VTNLSRDKQRLTAQLEIAQRQRSESLPLTHTGIHNPIGSSPSSPPSSSNRKASHSPGIKNNTGDISGENGLLLEITASRPTTKGQSLRESFSASRPISPLDDDYVDIKQLQPPENKPKKEKLKVIKMIAIS